MLSMSTFCFCVTGNTAVGFIFQPKSQILEDIRYNFTLDSPGSHQKLVNNVKFSGNLKFLIARSTFALLKEPLALTSKDIELLYTNPYYRN